MTKENDSIQCAVDRRLDALRVPDDLAQRVKQMESGKKRSRMVLLRRPVALAAALCLMFACSVGALAVSPIPQGLFMALGAQVSSLLQPIQRVCTDEGIETTVVAAMNDSNTMDVYIAVRDLEGTRIDETAMLCDVLLSGSMFDPMVQLVQFDEKTATATFLIEASGQEALNGKKVRLSIGGILLGGTSYLEQSTGISLAKMSAVFPAPVFQSLNGRTRSSFSVFSNSNFQTDFDCDSALAPAESDGSLDNLFPWGTLCAAGVANHTLHLLVLPNEAGRYADMDVALCGGKRTDLAALPRHSIEFSDEEADGEDGFHYTEYILPLPSKADLNRLSVSYTGTVYDSLVSGQWETTFQLESVSKQYVAYPDLTVNGWHIARVELSAIGVSVATDSEGAGWPASRPAAGGNAADGPPSIEVYDTTGNLIAVDSVSSSTDKNGCVLKNQFATPTPLELIGRVVVGGQEILFKK